MKPPFFIIILPIIIFFQMSAHSQGVRGIVKDDNGQPLPFASVFVSPARTGAATNAEGKYEFRLPSGVYTLRVQNIGYKAQEAQIEVKDGWAEMNFMLSSQGYMLQEVQIGKGRKEDFAYTIMRKSIAKRKFHQLQYNHYEMRVYIKGTGELTKAPFFLKNKLKKEGVNLNEAYTSESVSEIKFTQPNKIEERVIAIRTKGTNSSSASPAMFINQSFYKDKIGNFISPLSGSAFRWYKFIYEGSFVEGKNMVNKIRVIPRSKGDNLFDGSMYIIEDEWAIHSLDLNTSVMGFPINVRQNYAEVVPHLWMPVTHRYQFSGNVLGFAGRYNYLASCRNYKIELNKDLITRSEFFDEKVSAAHEEFTPSQKSAGVSIPSTPSNSKVSRKQFNKMMDEYEKQSLKKQKHPDVIAERSFDTDSSATKRNSLFWDSIRTVPLTVKEEKGYRRDDSLARIESVKITGKDSLKVIKKRNFDPLSLITGGSYSLSSRTSASIDPTFTQVYFNTVEGLNVNFSAHLYHRYDSTRRELEFAPVVRYGFLSRDLYMKGRLSKSVLEGDKILKFSLDGGKFVEQFNPANPIHPIINSFSSLLFRKNYMKIYKKTFSSVSVLWRPNAFFILNGSVEWERRRELFNHSNYSFFYKDTRQFSSNAPANIELQNPGFPAHNATILAIFVRFRPIATYRIYNNSRIALTGRSPELTLNFRKGIKGLLGSDVDYDRLELGLNHGLPVGAGGKLEFEIRLGTFVNNRSLYFMDYAHFDGNRTILSSLKPSGSFRLLDYYIYSTDGKYFSGSTHYQFRKFLLTRIPEVRYLGIKENIFFNYLKTCSSPNYFEIGYSLDNVFRLFRLEAAASFNNREYQDAGLRIGIATVFKLSGKQQ